MSKATSLIASLLGREHVIHPSTRTEWTLPVADAALSLNDPGVTGYILLRVIEDEEHNGRIDLACDLEQHHHRPMAQTLRVLISELAR